MERQHAPTRLMCVGPRPQTLLAKETASTVAEASRIHQPQAPITLAALFRRTQRLPRWATQGTVRLKSKVAPSKAALFERQGHFGGGLARGSSPPLLVLRETQCHLTCA